MAGYTVKKVTEIPDISGDYPGEMRLGFPALENEQVAFTWRRMPPQSGGKGSYGHRHKTQEEIYCVVEGILQFKLDDDVFEAGPGTVVRIAPEVVRSVWNEGPDDVSLIMVSTRCEDLMAEIEKVPDFWPE
jgi:mannose-6-phosphate isomerase-like protein (cupin superfamily)